MKSGKPKAIVVLAWLALAAYTGTMVWMVHAYQPNVTARETPNAYRLMSKAWMYNRFVLPSWLLLGVTVTCAWRRKRSLRGADT